MALPLGTPGANDPAGPNYDDSARDPQHARAPAMPDPKDGSIWSLPWGIPGGVVRIDPGSSPPMTTLAEIYRPQMPGFAALVATIIGHAPPPRRP